MNQQRQHKNTVIQKVKQQATEREKKNESLYQTVFMQAKRAICLQLPPKLGTPTY